jgi:hypothetical protein
VLLAFVFATCCAFAQAATPLPPQQDQVFQGTLVAVDTDQKTIRAKGAGNKETMFYYTDDTEISGLESGGAQVLAQKSGSQVNITYKVDHGRNLATRIEVHLVAN